VIDPHTSLIYIWTDGRVHVYKRKHRSNKQYRHLRPHGHNSFPAGCIPISGTFQAGNFVINGHAPIIHSPTNTSPYPVEMRLMNRGILQSTLDVILDLVLVDPPTGPRWEGTNVSTRGPSVPPTDQ
jgi:hypothetical protein